LQIQIQIADYKFQIAGFRLFQITHFQIADLQTSGYFRFAIICNLKFATYLKFDIATLKPLRYRKGTLVRRTYKSEDLQVPEDLQELAWRLNQNANPRSAHRPDVGASY